MRKLPVTTAIAHALRSVITYRMAGIRIGAMWMVVLLVLNAVEALLTDTAPGATRSPASTVAEIMSAIAGLLAFSSIAVNWHRFILRDELPATATSFRLDGLVLRYLGNSILALLAGLAPLSLLAAIVALLPQSAVILLGPAGLAAGTFIMMLSLKLPAIALDRRDFTFGQALKSADGNFWQILGVFVLNALVVFVPLLGLVAVMYMLRQASPAIAIGVGLILSVPLNLFFTLFSVSVLSSLYGFFVEKRDF